MIRLLLGRALLWLIAPAQDAADRRAAADHTAELTDAWTHINDATIARWNRALDRRP